MPNTFMFTSGTRQNPLSYSTETLFDEHYYTYDQYPNSVGKEPPFMLNFSLPCPYDHHGLPLSHILLQQQPVTIHDDVVVDQNERTRNYPINKGKNSGIEIANEAPMEPKPCEVTPAIRRNLNVETPRKRTVKRDRHSKICTAQGVRDRRMRMSIKTAREFFDLQDMLGFDRASDTVEWLFSQSKKAIKELYMNLPQKMHDSSSAEKSEFLMSLESEVLKSVVEEDVTLVEDANRKINQKLRNAARNHHRARECRKQARARARERTREKMTIRSLEKIKQRYESNTNNIDHQSSFSHCFETLEESTPHTQTHERSSPHQAVVDTIEKYLGTENLTEIAGPMYSYGNNGESSLGIDSNSNSLMGILGTWDKNSSRIIGSSDCAIMSMDSLAGNPTSTCITTSNFPSLLQ